MPSIFVASFEEAVKDERDSLAQSPSWRLNYHVSLAHLIVR